MTQQERDAPQARYTQAKEKCEAIIVALRGHGDLCRQLGEFLYGYDHDRLMQADPSRSPRRRRRAVEGGPDLSLMKDVQQALARMADYRGQTQRAGCALSPPYS